VVGVDGTWGCWSSQTSTDWMGVVGRSLTGVVDLDMDPVEGRTGCVVLDDGSVHCGAINPSTWSVVRPGAWVEVEVRSTYSYCVRDAAGAVSCWTNTAPVAAPEGVFTTLVATRGAWCGLRDDATLACWGTSDGDGVVAGVPSGTFSWVEAGPYDACAGRSDGTYTCWGAGTSALPRTHAPFADLSATSDSACGVTTEGELVCKGGQASSPTFATVAALPRTWRRISLSDKHGCALDDAGELACWANSSSAAAAVLTPPTGPFSDLAVGSTFGCAVDASAEVACFGTSTTGATTPPPGPFVDVDALSSSLCGLRPDGTITCWGATTPPSFPGTWRALDLGSASCALRADGTPACWGGSAGLLVSIDPTAVDLIGMSSQGRFTWLDRSGRLRLSWSNAPTLGDATDPQLEVVDGVDNHLCAITREGALVCWGVPASWMPPWAGY
jgi:hypothetical protein